jgi:hypothetical protein
MTNVTTTSAGPRVDPTGREAIGQLARIEAGRMLRHPAPWAGLALSGWWLHGVSETAWASSQYEGLLTGLTPLLLGVSVASASAFAREHVPVSDEAPLEPYRRSLARLLGGLALVALVGLVVAAGAVWLRVRGGLGLGDEPGHTAHAYYSLPELLQPVLLACFAVALGAAVVHLVRSRLVASVVLVLLWFLAGATYWMFQGSIGRMLTPLQVQPVLVEAGPVQADPTGFPARWLLSAPGQYQDFWGRLIVSPQLAAWHDLYLVSLTLLLVAVAVPGRLRRPLLVSGAVIAVGAVLMQSVVAP